MILCSRYSNAVIYHGPYAYPIVSIKDVFRRCRDFVFDVGILFNRKYRNTIVLTKSPLASRLVASKGFKDVRTVGVGLDVSRFDSSLSSASRKSKYNLMFVGRFEKNKNVLFLLDVFEECLKLDPNITLTIIGTGNGSYAKKVRRRIRNGNFGCSINVADAVPQEMIGSYYQAADLLLLPSLYEIFGMVLLEAGYFGCPAVASKNGGTSALANHKTAGLIIDDFDAERWAYEIISLLHDDMAMKKLSQIVREGVLAKFTWNRIKGDFLSAYESVLSNKELG